MAGRASDDAHSPSVLTANLAPVTLDLAREILSRSGGARRARHTNAGRQAVFSESSAAAYRVTGEANGPSLPDYPASRRPRMDRLKAKVAVITGGSGGIGMATARLFVAEGAQVVLVDLDEQQLRQAAAELGSAAVSTLAADVSDEAQARVYVDAALQRHGRLDVLFCNAGIEGAVAPIAGYPLAMFDRVLAVNVRGVFLGLQQALPVMASALTISDPSALTGS